MGKIKIPFKTQVMLSARIFTHQTFLKWSQMNCCTPVKEWFNPWVAFGVLGALQGGVYGQANIFFSEQLKIGKSLSLKGMFRGLTFAVMRDTLSGGIPFQCAGWVRQNVFDKLYPTVDDQDGVAGSIKKWSSVITTSMCASVISQGPHNCQILMQQNHDLNPRTAMQLGFKMHGLKLFYRGAEARMGLLLVVNLFNELLMRPAWDGVPIEKEI